MKKYIHYGHNSFDKEKFVDITNRFFVKPFGGLWASPVDAEYGWKDWCKDNDFRECNKSNSFEFVLSDNANIIHLYNSEDLDRMPKQNSEISFAQYLDFEKIKENGCDAIELHLSEDTTDFKKRDGLYMDLYGWDCDSILIMNPDIILNEESEAVLSAGRR